MNVWIICLQLSAKQAGCLLTTQFELQFKNTITLIRLGFIIIAVIFVQRNMFFSNKYILLHDKKKCLQSVIYTLECFIMKTFRLLSFFLNFI